MNYLQLLSCARRIKFASRFNVVQYHQTQVQCQNITGRIYRQICEKHQALNRISLYYSNRKKATTISLFTVLWIVHKM